MPSGSILEQPKAGQLRIENCGAGYACEYFIPPLSSSSPTNRRPKREQRLLANYAPQVGGKATEGGLKGRIGGVVEIALGVL
ncbi:MAG: hypothetical protein IJZ09_03415, partial [Tidjanibacter sp.]|nr:hypothetical protein [Tidjanibacter sp.]